MAALGLADIAYPVQPPLLPRLVTRASPLYTQLRLPRPPRCQSLVTGTLRHITAYCPPPMNPVSFSNWPCLDSLCLSVPGALPHST